jgi:DNA-binding NarL/FixJ family response regulator
MKLDVMKKEMIQIVLIDDDKLVCAALKTIIEAEQDIEVVGMGYNGKEAIELYTSLQPDVLLMDIRMDTMTGLEAAEQILAKHGDSKILFLTTFLDDEYIVKALKLGAKGYLIKQNFESIIPSIRAVYMGQSVFGDDVVTKIPTLLGAKEKVDFSSFHITEKELEIIQAVADGLSNKEIASSLYLGEGTIRNSITNILGKLQLRDRTQLAVFYYKQLD